jgi:tetratricopeptide (TPR) repeat protein
MKDWHTLKPELLKKQPYYRPGCDTQSIKELALIKRQIWVPFVALAVIGLVSALGWSSFSGPINKFVSRASADAVTELPLTVSQITDLMQAQLAQVQLRMKTAEAAELTTLLRDQDRLLRAISDPQGALEVAEKTRTQLNTVRRAYGLPDPVGSEAALAALANGDVAAAGPILNDIRSQAEAEIGRAATAAFALGNIALLQGNNAAAGGFFTRAVQLDNRYEYLIALARNSLETGNVAGAAGLNSALITSAVATYGESSEEHAEALSLAGQATLAAGKTADAEALMRKSIEVGAALPEVTGDRQAQRLSNLGVLLQTSGFAVEAEPFLRQAITIDREAPNGVYPDTYLRLANISELMVALSREAEADSFAEASYLALLQAHGKTHPDVARRAVKLAEHRLKAGKRAEAAALYTDAVASSRLTLGPYHPDFLYWLDQLSAGQRLSGDLEASEALYKEVLERTEARHGVQSAQAGRVMNNLGLVLGDRGQRDAAETVFRQAISILEASMGADHAQVKTVQANLAAMLNKQP